MKQVLSEQERLMGIRGEHSSVGDEPHPDQGPDVIVVGVMVEAAQDTGAPLSSDVQGAMATAPGEVME